jgi:dTDP-4-dehydrorhamnose 3,5-epimerase
MKVMPTNLPEVLVLEPSIHGDSRGFFMESYNERVFNDAVERHVRFVQDNHSRSARGVLRGLHYQLPPQAQGKLVRVTAGRVFDVAVDIRRDSRNFLQWAGVEISAENHRQLWIPPGFAHGFLVLSDSADFLYKTTGYYSSGHERSIRWNDDGIGIAWPLKDQERPLISDRDAMAPDAGQAELF